MPNSHFDTGYRLPPAKFRGLLGDRHRNRADKGRSTTLRGCLNHHHPQNDESANKMVRTKESRNAAAAGRLGCSGWSMQCVNSSKQILLATLVT